jgi:hypothetical protein
MKLAIPLFVIASTSVSASLTTASDELGGSYEYQLTETGKSWTVRAAANGTSTEVVIHLLQRVTVSAKGVGSVFMEDGRFPKPAGRVGKVFTEGGAHVNGKSGLFVKDIISYEEYCPESERTCGSRGRWTARQTTEINADGAKSPVLLETRVSFQSTGECKSFVAAFVDFCTGYENVAAVRAYVNRAYGQEEDFYDEYERLVDYVAGDLMAEERLAGLIALIDLLEGLRDSAPFEYIELIVPYAKDVLSFIEGFNSMWSDIFSRILVKAMDEGNIVDTLPSLI